MDRAHIPIRPPFGTYINILFVIVSGYKVLQSVDGLDIDIHSFFKIASSRMQEIKFIQLEKEVDTHILRYVTSRWLTLRTAVDRFIEQRKPLQKYFTDLANKEPKMSNEVVHLKDMCKTSE